MRLPLLGFALLLGACAGREPLVVRDGFCSAPPSNRPLRITATAPALPDRLRAAGFTREAVHMADVIGALDALDALRRAELERDGGPRAFMARQGVVNHIALAQLEMDAAHAALQCEGERGDLLRARLDRMENDRSRNLTLAGIVISAAFAGISGGLSLSGAGTASDIANIAGGAASGGAAAALLFGEPTGRLALSHTLLEELRRQPAEARYFPPRVWRYLTRAASPGAPTPAEELLEDWRGAGLLAEEAGPSIVFRADAELTSDALQQRDGMLDQLRARVALMSGGLRELLEEILARPAPPMREAGSRGVAR